MRVLAPVPETDKPPSVRPSKHGPKAPSIAPAVLLDDGERPRPLPPDAKPAIAAACAVALFGAVYFAMSGDTPPAPLASATPKPTATAATTAATPTTTAAPTITTGVQAAQTIKLHVEISPDYAKLSLDGTKLKAPFDGTLPKDGAKHVLKIDAPGHKQKKIEIIASADTNLVVALEPLPKVHKTAEPADPPPGPAPDPYD